MPVILGHAAAHEIGHLLLGSNSHSPFGLMRARWSGQDLQNACWEFSPDARTDRSCESPCAQPARQ